MVPVREHAKNGRLIELKGLTLGPALVSVEALEENVRFVEGLRFAAMMSPLSYFFDEHCSPCHEGGSKSGGLDLTEPRRKPDEPRNFERWVKVFDAVDSQGMPPPPRKQLDPESRDKFLKPMRTDLHAANLTRQQKAGRGVLRRLNRAEYENTLHDLLTIDLPLQHYLPEDATLYGFDNVSEEPRLSKLHLEQYLEAADAAITAATDLRRPIEVKTRFRYHDEKSVINDAMRPVKKSFRILPDAVVVFDDNSPNLSHHGRDPAKIQQLRLIEEAQCE